MDISFTVLEGTGSSNSIWLSAVDANSKEEKGLILMDLDYHEALKLVPDKVKGFKTVDAGDIGWSESAIRFYVTDEKFGDLLIAQVRLRWAAASNRLEECNTHVFNKSDYKDADELREDMEDYMSKYVSHVQKFMKALNWALNKKPDSFATGSFEQHASHIIAKRFTI